MATSNQAERDAADLEGFGYRQELKRELGTFSSFAVAFSYISPSTGIFTLYFLGVAAVGGYLFWTNYRFNAYTIGRANLDGSGTNINFLNANGPYGIAADAQHVYWANSGVGSSARL